ncbi:MAG: hypothetical protein OEY97_08070 [Nitrospirota bacterium]|nr:hypothetical protein [Nitrospirota bacterium]
MPKKISPEQQKKEARRALIIWILATAFFIFSLVFYVYREYS